MAPSVPIDFTNLPSTAFTVLFRYMDVTDLLNCAQVCSNWRLETFSYGSRKVRSLSLSFNKSGHIATPFAPVPKADLLVNDDGSLMYPELQNQQKSQCLLKLDHLKTFPASLANLLARIFPRVSQFFFAMHRMTVDCFESLMTLLTEWTPFLDSLNIKILKFTNAGKRNHFPRRTLLQFTKTINEMNNLTEISLDFGRCKLDKIVQLIPLFYVKKFKFISSDRVDVLREPLLTCASENNNLIHLENTFWGQIEFDHFRWYTFAEDGREVARRFTKLRSANILQISAFFTGLTSLSLGSLSVDRWPEMRHLVTLQNLIHLEVGLYIDNDRPEVPLPPLPSIRSLNLFLWTFGLTHAVIVDFDFIRHFPNVQILSLINSSCAFCHMEQIREEGEADHEMAVAVCMQGQMRMFAGWRNTLRFVFVEDAPVNLEYIFDN